MFTPADWLWAGALFWRYWCEHLLGMVELEVGVTVAWHGEACEVVYLSGTGFYQDRLRLKRLSDGLPIILTVGQYRAGEIAAEQSNRRRREIAGGRR